LVAVVHEPSRRLAARDGRLDGLGDQLGAHVVGHRQADVGAAEQVGDRRQVQLAFQRGDLLDIGDPALVGRGRGELALDQVRGGPGGRVAAGDPAASAAVRADQPGRAQQPRDPLATHPLAVLAQVGVDARRPVDAPGGAVERADLGGQPRVLPRARAGLAPSPGVVAGARHAQRAAQQADSVACLLRVDQPVDPHRRSVSPDEETHGLLQHIALFFQHPHPPAQLAQLLAFAAGQPTSARTTTVRGGLLDPRAQRLAADAQATGDLPQRPITAPDEFTASRRYCSG
jgi:hypothetical protein